MNNVLQLRSVLTAFLLLSSVRCFAASEVAQAKTEHFTFLYDPQKLNAVALAGAEKEAEAAFSYVSSRFPQTHYTQAIVVRLDARFRGATGYAAPGGKSGHGKQDVVGLRYEDLDTLGLTPRFLFQHELTHLFAARSVNNEPDRALGASALGEGLADLVANGRNGLGLPLSFARYLRDHSSWADPNRLFLHPPSGFPPQPIRGELSYDRVFRWRIERYVEPSLFLAYLSSRIGWEKLREFYIDYARAAQSRHQEDEIRTVLRRYTGKLPEDLFREWNAAMDAAPLDEAANRERWLSERVYSATQWYEFHVGGKVIPASSQPHIEAEFRTLHAEMNRGNLAQAESRLERLKSEIHSATVIAG